MFDHPSDDHRNTGYCTGLFLCVRAASTALPELGRISGTFLARVVSDRGECSAIPERLQRNERTVVPPNSDFHKSIRSLTVPDRC